MTLSNYKMSPLEGQPLFPVCVVLIIVFGFLATITDGFLSVLMWILLAPFAFLLISMMYMRFSSKWAGVHYPFMVRYAKAAGFQAGTYPDLPVSERVERALAMVVFGLYPNISNSEGNEIFHKIGQKQNVFLDKHLMIKMFKSRGSKTSEDKIEAMVDEILSGYKLDDEGFVNGLKVSHVVSEIIRFKHGEKVQFEYMFAVITGRAK